MNKRVIPEDRIAPYLKYCKDNPVTTICSTCEKLVEINLSPYFYDKDENDVYFASVCPNCGDLIIIKE